VFVVGGGGGGFAEFVLSNSESIAGNFTTILLLPSGTFI